MRPTQREAQAARSLAESILEFYLAMEEGRVTRTERARKPPQTKPVVPANPERDPAAVMTSRQAAKYLSVGERTMWKLTAPRGPIPSVRMGRVIRFRVKDLDDYLAQVRVRPNME